MNDTERFTGRHLDYAAARPSYPRAAIDYLCGAYAPPRAHTAADVGSGTGKLSAQLLEAGFTVYGVEPNADMRRTAEELLGGSGRFRSVDGSDRATGLAEGSVDFVTAAQAFHWFDPLAFRAECLRILRPGGRVFLIWNVRAEAPLNQALAGVFQRYCPDFKGFSGGIREDDERIRTFFRGGYEKLRFPSPLAFDRERFLRRCFSSSYSLPEGRPDYPAYCQALEALFDAFSRDGLLTQPNETLVYAGRPLPGAEDSKRSTY